MTCESCRQQMLPYLYDLLEPSERAQLAGHIEDCPGCQEALQAAQEQVGLLAEAIKQDAAAIVFKAPPKPTPASTAPTVALRPAPTPRRWLNRGALAASVLLCLFLIGAGLGFTIWRDQARALADAQTRLADARLELTKSEEDLQQKKQQTQREIRAIQTELDQIFQQWKKKETTQRTSLEKDRVQLTVDGPKSPLAGAPNTYNVEVRPDQAFLNNLHQNTQPKGMQQNLAGGPPPVQARVLDQKKNVVYQQDVAMQGNNISRGQVVLPANMPIKPGAQLALEFQTKNADGKMVSLTTDPFTLGFPECVTHLATDRPLYRPGDIVRFRSLTLERFSLKPAEQDFHLRFRIVGPRNEERFTKDFLSTLVTGKDNAPIKGPDGKPVRGLGAGEFPLPADLPDGQYTLTVSEVNERFNEEKRLFQVRRLQKPRLNMEVQFDRSVYGPGDQVKAVVHVAPNRGQLPLPPNNNIRIRVDVDVDVDGRQIIGEVGAEITVHDPNGQHTTFPFALPEELGRGVVTVAITCTCNDGGVPEKMVRAVPIVLRDLNVEFYPEGGDLIAGVPNRVYFQARTPANRPADFEGVILDGQQEIARVKTLSDDRDPGINQGLGSFTFTPQRNRKYMLRIDAPIGIERLFPLPASKSTGVVLSVPQGVVENEIPIHLTSAQTPRDLFVGACCRGRMLDGQTVRAPANRMVPLLLKPHSGVGGVYRITVFEKTQDAGNVFYRPLAERLIYRRSQERVEVKIDSDRKTYQPGEPVQLRLQAVNEKKEIVPALALVAVIDDRVNRLSDDKTARGMPTHFLLTTEVCNPQDMENADVLLGDHPKAAAALDLLLGCQGWRRFAEQDPQRFAQKQDPGQRPIFLANAAPVPQRAQTEQKEIDQLDQAFVAKAIDLNKKIADKENDLVNDKANDPPVVEMQRQVQASQNEINTAQQRLRQIRGIFWQFGLGGAVLTLLFIGFFLISVGLRRLSDGGAARPWLVVGLALLTLLFLASAVGTFTLIGKPFFEEFGPDFKMGVEKGPAGKPAPPPFPRENLDAAPPSPAAIDPGENEPDEMPAAPRRVAKVPAAPNRPIPTPRNQPEIAGNGIAAHAERELRRQGNYQALLEKQLGRRVQLPAVNDPCVVREYAHHYKPHQDDAGRDFTATLYWHPALVLPDGKAMVTFDLPDAIARYDVLVLSHTCDGRLGANRAAIIAKLPFSVDPQLPIEVTQSDQIAVPVAVCNEKSAGLAAMLSARGNGLQIEGNAQRTLPLKANETRREIFRVKPSIFQGDASFRIAGKTQGRSDTVERKLKIVPDGFPVVQSIGGVIENGPIEHVIDLPEQWIPGSLRVQAHFYPSPLAELQSGLEAMRRAPTGCFEQCASSNYVSVLMLDYMKKPFVQLDPFAPVVANVRPNAVLEKHCRQLLQTGHRQLAQFECGEPNNEKAKRGYEWFGGAAPPHEALTAYGLVLFRDLARFYPVDELMLRRTEQCLLDQRDGKGGFRHNPGANDPFGQASDHIKNAYIIWALSESGEKENLDQELAVLSEECKTVQDPYFLALAGMSHLNRKKTPRGIEILHALTRFQANDGQVAGAKTSIIGSQGRDLAVETTSLAILAWLKADRPGEFSDHLKSALKWLGQQRQGQGGYGGTQATLLALKAMVAHARKNPRALQNGVAQIALPFLPGDMDRAPFSAHAQETITLTLPDVTVLKPGKNAIQLNVTGDNALPYTLTWSYRTLKAPSDPKAPVRIAARLGAAQVKQGDTVKLFATVENVSGQGQGMAVAVIGLPAGLSIPEDARQFQALTRWQNGKPGKIAAWELLHREVVFYWRELAPNAKIDIELDLSARVAGIYRGPASRAYLYYEGERKCWTEPLNIRIDEAK